MVSRSATTVECGRCLLTSEVTTIKDGTCEFCKTHDKLERLDPGYIFNLADKLRQKKGYHCLVGISGGLDSCYLLWYTVKVLRLRPLCLHFNNKWNTQEAEHNMEMLVRTLGVDLIRINSDTEYDELCGAFLRAGVKDADIPNDMYMADMMQTVCRMYGIKHVFNGHDFRREGSTPLCWTYMDAKYMRDVYRQMTAGELETRHIQTFWKQIIAGLRGIKHIRVFHYIDISADEKYQQLMDLGVKDYGIKHGENIYTKFVGYYLLPKKWGIDKRIIYLSAQVRSGYITKEQARMNLNSGVDFDVDSFDPILQKRCHISVEQAMDASERTYEEFDHYHFKRWKLLLWLMAKMKLTSYNFYKKYT